MKRILFLLLLLPLCGTLRAATPRGGETVDPRLLEVQRRMAAVSQIGGEFVQEKKLDFLNDPVVASGRFSFAKPGTLTWEYVSPSPSGLKIENGKVTMWNGPPGARTPQSEALAKPARMMAEQVMMWMNFNPREILAIYEVAIVSDSPLTVKVTPRREGLRRMLKSITMILEEDLQTVRSVALEEDAATTTLTFTGVTFDQGPQPGMAP